MAIFENRVDAAGQLAHKLKKYKGVNGVVLAVPRGGVPVGAVIAKELGLPLEITLSKKIGHPHNPELAIGAVTLEGAVIDGSVIDVSEDYIRRESEKIYQNLKARYNLFMGAHKPLELRNKTVIIVDDGVATGSTVKACINAIRKSKPKEVIVAVPVSPPDTARELSAMTDEFICLYTPEDFYGVGQFYEDFSQVSDEEVKQYLEKYVSA